MSIEFSQDMDTPIISPTFAPQDAGEIGLRPKLRLILLSENMLI